MYRTCVLMALVLSVVAAMVCRAESTPSCMDAAGEKHMFIAGQSFDSRGKSSLWIWKIDVNGKKVWEKTFETPSDNGIVGICATSDGGLLMAKRSPVGIAKLDSSGNITHSKNIKGYDQATVFMELSDGHYLLGGWLLKLKGKDSFETDVWLIKLDVNGKTLWEQVWDKGASEILFSGMEMEDGKLILAATSGNTNKFGQGPIKGWVFKCRPEGDMLADIILPDCRAMGTGRFMARGGKNFAVSCSASSLPPIGNLDFDEFPSFGAEVLCLDKDMKSLWKKSLKDYSSPFAPAICATSQGDYLIAGATSEGVRIDLIDSKGKQGWKKIGKIGAKGDSMFDVKDIVMNGSLCFVLGNVADLSDKGEKDRVFLLKMETKTPEIVWMKTY